MWLNGQELCDAQKNVGQWEHVHMELVSLQISILVNLWKKQTSVCVWIAAQSVDLSNNEGKQERVRTGP